MEKKKTVCHLTSVHPPFDIRIFYKECISLAKAGYQVSLIAPIPEPTQKEGVAIVPISLPKSRFKRMLIAPFRMFRLAQKQKAEIYHFHDAELMLTGILLRLAGKKVIYDIHENNRLNILDKDYLGPIQKKVFYYGYLWFEKIAVLFYNRLVLALSEETYKQYYPAEKSTIVLNFPLFRESINKKFAIDKRFIRFVYVGVIHKSRGIHEMLQIIFALKTRGINAKLDLVGALRPEALKKEIQNFIQQKGLQDQIQIHGFVDASKIAGYLHDAHFGLIFLHPFKRYQEALPTKMFEYMQHGLPVITNNYPLYKKYVEQTQTGLCIDVNNLDNAVIQIMDWINDPQQIKQMGENGMALTQTQFNWNSQEEKLLNLYKNL